MAGHRRSGGPCRPEPADPVGRGRGPGDVPAGARLRECRGFEEPGSHGCVNLRHHDAKALWSGLELGDRVYVRGTRTGG
ncbi:L,D-transpeptidase [Streptomyces uncialis]|uniref:L,D-transpeptidase n=1 Tax=Streptomyces uncialis TaxID=1048205 RepID=UPI0037F259D9